MLFYSKLSDPSCPFVIGEKETFTKLPESTLKMREGFGGVLLGCKKKIKF